MVKCVVISFPLRIAVTLITGLTFVPDALLTILRLSTGPRLSSFASLLSRLDFVAPVSTLAYVVSLPLAPIRVIGSTNPMVTRMNDSIEAQYLKIMAV